MFVRKAEAVWNGGLKDGKGTMSLASGAYQGPYSFSSRFEDGPGTNPEELIGGALAGCFSMAFSADLERAGYTAASVHTRAEVKFEKRPEGFSITSILLRTDGKVPGVDQAEFLAIAEKAKQNCPISRALRSVEVNLEARLVS